MRSTSPPSVTGGGGTVTLDAYTDAFSLTITTTDSNAAPTDDATFALALALTDTNDAQTETVSLGITGFADSNDVPTDSNTFTMRVWLSGSTGTSGNVTNPANANGQNDGAIGVCKTVVAGATTARITSNLGGNIPAGVTLSSVIYRGWFSSVNSLTTSGGQLIFHSPSALFSDLIIFTNQALNTTIDHLAGTFTYDVLAGGINTLAKLQDIQMWHNAFDLAAGVSPTVLNVDAGCLEIAGAFS